MVRQSLLCLFALTVAAASLCVADPSHITVGYRDLWRLAGTVEELRNYGVQMPYEVDAILDEALAKVNFPAYMKDTFPANRQRLWGILQKLNVPPQTPKTYGDSRKKYLTDNFVLKPFLTPGYFMDRVLDVGLKSYPCVLDYNGDGKKDLLVGDHDGFIYIFLNIGIDAAPVFGRGQRLRAVDTGKPLIIQPNPKLTFGDLNGDGSLDLVQGNYYGQPAIVPNRAKRGFAFAVADISFPVTKSGPIDVGNYTYPELVDFDGDGVLDLVIGNIQGEMVWFRNVGQEGKYLFDKAKVIEGIEPLTYPHAVFGDWNGDGKKDLVLGHREGTIVVYLNVSRSGPMQFKRHDFARHPSGQPVRIGLLSHPCVVDWNNDGKLDLVVGNDPGQIKVFLNGGTKGHPEFDRGTMLIDGGGELIMGVHSIFTVSDVTGDGKKDLVVGHEENRLRVFENTGTPDRPAFDHFTHLDGVVMVPEVLAAQDPTAQKFWNRSGLRYDTEYLGNLAPCLVDLDGDGRTDLLVGNYTGLVYFFKNKGATKTPRFGEGRPLRTKHGLLRVAGFSSPVVCDWNHDGHLDLISGDLLGRIRVFLGQAGQPLPMFAESFAVTIKEIPVELGPRTIVEVTDLNGDGNNDLLVGNRAGEVFALLNVGSDRNPQFAQAEQLRDQSMLWRNLYDGCQFSKPFKPLFDKFPSPGQPQLMNVVETACPRAVDLKGSGRLQLWISHRYGRIFDFGILPQR